MVPALYSLLSAARLFSSKMFHVPVHRAHHARKYLTTLISGHASVGRRSLTKFERQTERAGSQGKYIICHSCHCQIGKT